MNRILWARSSLGTLRRTMSSQPSPGSQNSSPTTGAAADSAATPHRTMPKPQYRPTELQKFILVWTKKYKSKAEIPNLISPDLIQKSQSQARIKLANILILLTALASLGAIISGKAAAKRGESVHQINKDFHKKYQEDYDKEHGVTSTK